MTNEEKKEIGKRIQRRRKELRLTQKELAERVHKAEGSIRQYENGLRMPDETTKVAIANALGVSYADLFVPDQTSMPRDPSEMSIDMDALKRGDVEHAIKEPADLIATFKDENENPVNYVEHFEPATDEERDQFIDLLLRTGLSAEKRAEMLNYFDFINFKEEHKKE